MPGRIRRWAKGYVGVRIRGYTPERFLNLCRNGQLECWGVRQGMDGCDLYLSRKDFYRIRPLLRKARVSMRITARAGLPFVLWRNRRRKALAVAVLSFFMILFGMSRFLWNISFEGNLSYSRETLLDYLEEEEIRCGMRKCYINCEQLEEGMRSRFPEITWVSARVSGTRLLVKIKENEVLSSIPKQENGPCDLVASAGGRITRLIVRQGKAAVSVGDEVEEGQVLVSGQLSLFNDAAEVIRTAYVHADGDIFARTEYRYEKEYPAYHTVYAGTGRKRKGFGIAAGPYRLRFLLPDFEKNSWRDVTRVTQVRLFTDVYLPLYVETIRGEAYVLYERAYTAQEKTREAETLQDQYLKNLMEKGVQIIENNVKIQEEGVSWRVEGTVIGEEQIGRTRDITEDGETDRTDERN